MVSFQLKPYQIKHQMKSDLFDSDLGHLHPLFNIGHKWYVFVFFQKWSQMNRCTVMWPIAEFNIRNFTTSAAVNVGTTSFQTSKNYVQVCLHGRRRSVKEDRGHSAEHAADSKALNCLPWCLYYKNVTNVPWKAFRFRLVMIWQTSPCESFILSIFNWQ